MDIHLRFEPDALRAQQIDRRMNRELAASLRYVCQQVRNELDFDEAAILALTQALEAGYRVDAEIFAAYYDLVAALLNGDAEESSRLMARIQSAQPTRRARRFVRLRTPGECDLSKILLAKFLDDADVPDVLPPPAEVADQFADRFDRGLYLMRRVAPELAGEVDAIVHEVIPVVGDPTNPMQIDGGSHYQLWGALFLNAQFHPTDEAMVEVIAHESAHSLLFGLCTHQPLVLNDDDELYPSPLRTDLRPMDGIYHATFVSARMHWVMSRLLDSGLIEAARRHEIAAARDLDGKNFEAGYSVVQAHGRLTDLGSEVMAGAQRYMAST